MEKRTEMGWVLEVTTSKLGSALSADVAPGSTVLPVDDAVDFDEGGGLLRIGNELLMYSSADPDADTVTLTTPWSTGAEVDEPVIVWDEENDMAKVEYRALVECMSALTDDDPVAAGLQHGLAVLLPVGPRDGRGETVLLEQDGGVWRVVDVLGKDSVLEVMYGDPDGRYLSLGMHGISGVRLETENGEQVQKESLRYDVGTGDLTILGEFGTAPPGEVGIFAFSTKFSSAGQQVTRPTLQFNVGAGMRKQPTIMGDTELQSGLWIYGGARTAEREVMLSLDNQKMWGRIESTPAGGYTNAAMFQLSRESFYARSEGTTTDWAFINVGADLQMRSRKRYGASNATAELYAWDPGGSFAPTMHVGFNDVDGGYFEGLRVNKGTSVRVLTAGPLEVTSSGAMAWRSVHALDLVPMSDAASKTNITDSPIDALRVVRSAPVYEWEYLDDPGVRRLGVMANDLPDVLVETLSDDAPTPGPGTLGLSLVQQVAVLWQAVQELDAEIGSLRPVDPEKP